MSELLRRPVPFDGRTIPNPVVIQPMEGCDCLSDGSPSELTETKYLNNARSAAGIIWFEATAVCEEGRTNPRQMRLTPYNLPTFQKLTERMRATALRETGTEPLLFLQLTHSGRQSIHPRIAYRHPIYEETRPVTDDCLITDEALDRIPEAYAVSADLARRAGFDGVDVKSCHGYLIQELLSAYTREGRYGGSFENRTRLYLDCMDAVLNRVGGRCSVVTRLGVTDMVPKPYGFGTDEANRVDLTETKRLIGLLRDRGIHMINVTMGNPYYNPHVNRPYRHGAYVPPEPPEAGLDRFRQIESELKRTFPDLLFVGSGLSFYRDCLFEKAEEMLEKKVCDLVGFGRMGLAYPTFYRDYLQGTFDPRKCCVTCSKCTTLMRRHTVSGCAVFNEYYRHLYQNLPEV